MRRRFPNFLHNRKIVLSLAGLGLLALFGLAISLESLTFEPGEVFDFQQTNSFSEFLKLLSFDHVVTAVIIIFLIMGVIATIYALTKKDLRGLLLKRFLQMLILGAIFLVLIVLSGGKEPELVLPTATPVTPPKAVDMPDFLENPVQPEKGELPPLAEPPPVLNYLFSLVVIVAIGAAAWTIWRRNRKTNLHELADIAMAASDDIEAGLDIEDVILRCYAQLMEVVKQRRGLNRRQAMTPAEFASWLEGAGLPGEPLQKLTHLFERVRYGAYRYSKEEATQATDCLREIAVFCGDGRT